MEHCIYEKYIAKVFTTTYEVGIDWDTDLESSDNLLRTQLLLNRP
jgi:hypothetical protein